MAGERRAEIEHMLFAARLWQKPVSRLRLAPLTDRASLDVIVRLDWFEDITLVVNH
jgi:hypothetical protein